MLDSLPGKVTSAGFSGLDATEPPNTYQRAVVNAAKSEGVTEGVIELYVLRGRRASMAAWQQRCTHGRDMHDRR